MKFIFGFLIIVNIVSEAIESQNLKVSIFYESLCKKSMKFFRKQLWPAYQDKRIAREIQVELVPFGRAEYSENPFTVICHHGPRECFGNAIQACFMAQNPDNDEQVSFVSCCMSERDPPGFGELCSKIMGTDYEDLVKCTKTKAGKNAQLFYAKKTKKFLPDFKSFPAVLYNDEYNKRDCKKSLKDFKKVIRRKLSERKKGKKKINDFCDYDDELTFKMENKRDPFRFLKTSSRINLLH